MNCNAELISNFASRYRERTYPSHVVDAAKQCLVDWFGVCLGALDEPAALAVQRTAAAWRSDGNARFLLGGRAASVVAALVNGTLAHSLDYDDTHLGSNAHLSGPTWAAALAVGTGRASSERDVLSAFITAFEVGARIGDGGVGTRLTQKGWHTSAVIGRFSAAVAAGALLGLDEASIRHALGLAATQAGGLTGSFGTLAKPFHAGKAAADGVMAAELAGNGLTAALDVLDSDHGLVATLLQDRATPLHITPFGEPWEITHNSFKPYAACLFTHAAIDSARALSGTVGNANVKSIRVLVNPLVIEHAGRTNPSTPYEGKFSLAYTIALGLTGRGATVDDFTPASLRDSRMVDLASRVTAVRCDELQCTAARLELTLFDGRVLTNETLAPVGTPGNPLSWPQLETKFMSLAERAIGHRAAGDLFGMLHDFQQPGTLGAIFTLLDAHPPHAHRRES